MTHDAGSVPRVRLALPADWPVIDELTRTSYGPNGPDAESRSANSTARLCVTTAADGKILGTVTTTRPDIAWAEGVGPGEAGIEMLALDGASAESVVAALFGPARPAGRPQPRRRGHAVRVRG